MIPRTTGKMAVSRAPRAKKSFTLSPSSVAFLEKLRKQQKASSTSAVLDQLLQEAEARQKKIAFERSILAYYDNLEDGEQEEAKFWGDFALRQMTQRTFE